MEEALHDIPLYREFALLDAGMTRLPDESAILRFRHLLEAHELSASMLATVNEILQGKGLMLKVGSAVDATLSAAPNSTLVTGASGGVGGCAIALLARRGTALSRRPDGPRRSSICASWAPRKLSTAAHFRSRASRCKEMLGSRHRFGGQPYSLANVCAGLCANGAVAACGLAQGIDLPATVARFILRSAGLLGTNSVTRPSNERVLAWQRLCRDLDLARLDAITHDIGLAEAIPAAADLLAGKVRGRLVVDVNR